MFFLNMIKEILVYSAVGEGGRRSKEEWTRPLYKNWKPWKLKL